MKTPPLSPSSMTSRSSLLILFGLLVPLFACGMLKKKQPDTEPSAVASVAPPPPVVTTVVIPVPALPPEAKVADEAIPTSEDFEDEAVQKVNDKSYKAELETLKKEIEAAK
jgi:hypothetical protein